MARDPVDEHVRELLAVVTDDADEDVRAAGADAHHVHLRQLGDLGGDRLDGVAAHPELDLCPQEAEVQRARYRDDLHDVGAQQAGDPLAHARLADAQVLGDRREGAPAVPLQVAEDRHVRLVECLSAHPSHFARGLYESRAVHATGL